MPTDNNTAALGSTLTTGHELDEAVIAAAKKRMVGKAEPLLAALFASQTSAQRGIDKRQEWVNGLPAQAEAVRTAYDAGNEKALAEVEASFEKYSKSLLRAKKTSGSTRRG